MKFKTPATLRATFAQIGTIRRDPKLIVWTLVVLTLPFYVFDSGVPQPSDWFALGLLVMLLRSWNGRMPSTLLSPLRSLLIFIGYVILVNVVWSLVSFKLTLDTKDGFIISPTFYIFNGLMFFTFLLMFQRYGEFLLWLSVRLVLAAVFLQVVLSAIGRTSHGRSTGMFNNPNQLGYYALLSAGLILFGQKRFQLSTWLVTAGLAACSYLALTSASKAALASIAGLGVVLLISKLRTVFLVSIVFGVLIFTSNPFSKAIDKAQHRIETDESYGFFEERGYDRIVAFPEYWVLGAGEGGYMRFKGISAIGAHELHSSMATLFFCYGFAGVLLFGRFLWGTIAGSKLRPLIVVGAAFAYGMTHQGLRFRMFWMLLAMVCALREVETRDRLARLAKRLTTREAA